MHRSPNVPGISRYGRLLLTVFALFASIAQAVVPTPTVTGPIPGDTPGSADRNYTFWATDIVLQNFGYVEQEFFFDGLARKTHPHLADGEDEGGRTRVLALAGGACRAGSGLAKHNASQRRIGSGGWSASRALTYCDHGFRNYRRLVELGLGHAL